MTLYGLDKTALQSDLGRAGFFRQLAIKGHHRATDPC